MTKLRTIASWAVIPAILAMQLFDLRRALIGPGWIWSTLLLGFSAATVVLVVLAWPRLRELWQRREMRLVVLGFTALLGYATVSALVSGTPYTTSRTYPNVEPPNQFAPVPIIYRLVPLATAFVTMTTAVLAVLVIEPAKRWSRLWWGAVTIVASCLALWPRGIIIQKSLRLATGMGGSATLHLVLLLSLGVLAGAAVAGYRRWWSAAGAALAVAAIVLTGSRSGLLSLAAFCVLVGVWFLGRISLRWVLGVAVLGALFARLMLWVMPSLRRLLSLSDEGRAANLETSLRILGHGWRQWVFGAGSGRVWPWYAFDARYYTAPWRSQVNTSQGRVLTNPHSVLLGVGVELGIIGLALLAVALVPLVVVAVRRWRWMRAAGRGQVAQARVAEAQAAESRAAEGQAAEAPTDAHTHPTDLALLAVMAGFVAFVLDYYLLKNFAVSFWWWFVVAAALTATDPRKTPAWVTTRRKQGALID